MHEKFDIDDSLTQFPGRSQAPTHARREESSGVDEAAELRLADYLKVLYKRRWTAGTIFAVVLGLVTVQTFTATPIYEATARLLIESDERNVVSFEQVIEENRSASDYYQTQYSILRSRTLARRVLDQQQLWSHPAFGGPSAQPESRSLFSNLRSIAGAPTAALRQMWGSKDASEERAEPPADETAAESLAIDALLGSLSVRPVRNSRLVDVGYTSPDPVLAAQITNGVARAYIEQNLEYKFLASKEASDWLGERLGEQRAQVEAAEAALQRYRERNDAISLEDRENIVVQKLADLNAAVTRAKTVRIEKEALYNQLRASQSNPALLDTFPAILSNAFIQQQKTTLAELQRQEAQLSEKFGPKHPDLVRVTTAIQHAQAKLEGEIAKVVQSVRSEFQSASAQEGSLTAALNAQKSEAMSMNRKAIDYGVLQRDVDSSKQMYDSLMQRAKETGVAGALRTSNIRIVDSAERPRTPVSPQKRRNVLFGGMAGLALAVGLVFFFELLDSRIKTPDDIKAHLGLSTLGLLPVVESKTLHGGYPLLGADRSPQFNEALKTIRTNLLFSTTNEGPNSLVVTSTGPGEGKSTVAANIAISLAQTGQRVLLVDADMRKPKAHLIFELPSDPGLSNLVVGQAKASEVVQRTTITGLWLMAAGKLPPNPAELVGGARFKDIIESLRRHFEWVIIDSPPVMAVTDAVLISHGAHATVFVIGAEMTNRQNAKKALEQLAKGRGRVVGAVLNRVDLKANPFYYSDYYRPEYAAYYSSTVVEEPVSVAK